MSIRVEIMLEEVTALMFRGDNKQAEQASIECRFRAYFQIFCNAVDLARTSDIFPGFAPHFCFVHAQFAHLLGRDQAAVRSYQACSTLLVPGSELGLLVEICQAACKGIFSRLLLRPEDTRYVRNLTERCKSSSNATLCASAHFMSSFLEDNRVASKYVNNIAQMLTAQEKTHNRIRDVPAGEQ